jgi:tetratricopeptide (TPR) repeat protein
MESEDLLEHMQPWSQSAESIVRSCGGWLAPFYHTGLLSYFGYPRAREEAVRMAVHAAREIREVFSGLLSSPGFVIRIAINTGEVTSDPGKNVPDASGEKTRETLALAREAPPGAIVASAAAALSVRRFFRMESIQTGLPEGGVSFLGRYILGGEILDETLDHDFVGREQEFLTLRDLWEKGSRGDRQIVWIIGDAGIGKSSLVRALVRLVNSPGRSSATVREFFCLPEHQGTSWSPITRHLRSRLGLDERISLEERLYRIERYLLSNGRPVAEELPLLKHFLEGEASKDPPLNSPERMRFRIETLLLDILSQRVRGGPLLLVLEDVHWADNATVDLLQKTLLRLVDVPMMVLVTSRTEDTLKDLALPAPDLIVRLNPLGLRESRVLVERLHAGACSMEEMKEILDLGGGVPLFLKELVSARIERSRRSGGSPPGRDGLPPTLRDLLASRIDSLGESKYMAQVAACLGQRFSSDLLEATMGAGLPEETGKIRSGLSLLLERGILEEEKEVSPVAYTFSHALVRKAILESLSRPVRRTIYGRIADILAALFPDKVLQKPEVQAEYMTQAGRTSEAVEMWMKAAKRTAGLGAFRDSCAHLEKALDLVQKTGDGEREQDILIAMGPIALMSQGYGSFLVEKIYDRAMELCGRGEKSPRSFQALFGLWASVLTRRGPGKAYPLAEDLEKMAGKSQCGEERLRADYSLGNSLFWLGNLERSERTLEKALSRSRNNAGIRTDPFESPYAEDPEVNSLSFLSFNRALRGDPDAAAGYVEKAIVRAGELNHPNSMGFALAFKTYQHIFLNEKEKVRHAVRCSLDLVERYGFSQWGALALLAQAWADSKTEDIEKTRESARRIGEFLPGVAPLFTMVEAQIFLNVDRVEESLETLERGRDQSRQTGTILFEPEFLRLEGEIILRSNGERSAQAGRLFREAMERALSMGAVWFAYRAVLSLSRAIPEEGKRIPSVLERITGGRDIPEILEGRKIVATL